MLDHAELNDLTPGYVLNILSEEERREFDAHLVSCEVCPPMITEFRAVAQILAESAPECEPPPALRSRILAAVHEEAATAEINGAPSIPLTLPVVSPADTARSWWSPLFRQPSLGGAFAVLLLAVAGLGWWNLRLQSDVSTLRDELAITQLRRDRAYEAVEVMARAETWWRTGGSALAPESSMSLAYSSQDNQGCLMVWGLPQVAGKTYVIWLIKGGEATRAGRLLAFQDYYWRLIEGDVRAADDLHVTLEDSDQVAKPSGPPVQMVSLRR